MEHFYIKSSLIKVEEIINIFNKDSSEEELIKTSQAGNINAFEELVKRNQDMVFNTAFRLMGNYDDALDLAQETFIRSFKSIGTYENKSKFSTWLYSITSNLSKNRWKSKQIRNVNKTSSISHTDYSDDEEGIVLISKAPDPREKASGKEKIKFLEDVLAELPFEKKQVFVLRFIQGLSYEEIAQILACSIGTVKSKINRLREELKEQLKEYL